MMSLKQVIIKFW